MERIFNANMMSNREKLEKAAENKYTKGVYIINGIDIADAARESFIEGAKWQVEHEYSEEEVLQLLEKREFSLNSYDMANEYENTNEWFEQFKKK
jgi:hypothetical protein